MADKLAALTLLAKHLKLFTEKVEASVDAKASVEGAREKLLALLTRTPTEQPVQRLKDLHEQSPE
jgi:hypothetical protein